MKTRATISCTCLAFLLTGTESLFAQQSWIHPDAISQPTSVGQIIRDVEVVDGKIYTGYGDYTANTGPINVRYFDPDTDSFSDSLITTNSEAIFRYKELGGNIYALHADPLFSSNGGYATGPSDRSGPWTENNSMPFVHVYDIAQYGPSNDLYLAGSGGPTLNLNSTIYRSTDGGQNWTDVVDAPPIDEWFYSGPGDTTIGFSRFYGLGEINGQLHAHQTTWQYEGDGTDNFGNATFLGTIGESYVYDGNTWITGPERRDGDGVLNRFVDPEYFDGLLVSRTSHSGGGAQRLFTFDGTTTDSFFMDDGNGGLMGFHDYVVDGDLFYALRADKQVYSTTDLMNWDFVLQAPSDARSIAILGNDFYFGGGSARLYRMSIPEPSMMTFLGAAGSVLILRRRRRHDQ